MKILIIDGYVDEPSAFGVPPYLSFHLRYIYGAIKSLGFTPKYLTIDQYRSIKNNNSKLEDFFRPDLLVIVSGCLVPGKYLRGSPITLNESKEVATQLEPKISIFGGATARFGFGGIGGEHVILSKKIKPVFDHITKQDIDATVYDYLRDGKLGNRKRTHIEWNTWSVYGAELITLHPDYPQPLIVEIETMQGCPRFINGGCNFCIEPLLNRVNTRSPNEVVNEIEKLSSFGALNFRLGGQSDVYSYMADEIGNLENPRPNPEAWLELFTGIKNAAPNLQVLQLDNANPAVIAQYPAESRKITKLFVEHCTSGNILPFGLESADEKVIKLNNLNTTPEETLYAIRQLNELGNSIGNNGLPKLLPGLNFVFGLLGETKQTFKENYAFLQRILHDGFLLRRINLRQVSSLGHIEFNPDKYKDMFHRYKRKIREEIDQPMLQRIIPIGRILKNVYMEKNDDIFTHGRQIGSYPILVSVPDPNLKTDTFYDIFITDHGYRSISGIPIPIEINNISLKSIRSLPTVGNKRANKIFRNRPYENINDLETTLDADTNFLNNYKLKEYFSFIR